MRKLLGLLLLVLVVFLVLNRNRVYLRDPLATVTRDGTSVSNVKVMINYANDVLLDDSGLASHRRLLLVQHWNQTLETPSAPLRCVAQLACLLDADQASAMAVQVSAKHASVSMSDKAVNFVDTDGGHVTVKLR